MINDRLAGERQAAGQPAALAALRKWLEERGARFGEMPGRYPDFITPIRIWNAAVSVEEWRVNSLEDG